MLFRRLFHLDGIEYRRALREARALHGPNAVVPAYLLHLTELAASLGADGGSGIVCLEDLGKGGGNGSGSSRRGSKKGRRKNSVQVKVRTSGIDVRTHIPQPDRS